MKPSETGQAYDAIAQWWTDSTRDSTAGFAYLEKAMAFCVRKAFALDVGCGAGRLAGVMGKAGFRVTGIDVSAELIKVARAHCPNASFLQADICSWNPSDAYDLVVAWDSTFHVPHERQADVTRRLCRALAKGGVVLFTAGGVDGVRMGAMQGRTFYHSSLNAEAYVKVMREEGCACRLLERDQCPEEHIVIVGVME